MEGLLHLILPYTPLLTIGHVKYYSELFKTLGILVTFLILFPLQWYSHPSSAHDLGEFNLKIYIPSALKRFDRYFSAMRRVRISDDRFYAYIFYICFDSHYAFVYNNCKWWLVVVCFCFFYYILFRNLQSTQQDYE
jgi:hypothetical protein